MALNKVELPLQATSEGKELLQGCMAPVMAKKQRTRVDQGGGLRRQQSKLEDSHSRERKLHVPRCLNINEAFKVDNSQVLNRLLVPKNLLLQSGRHKEEVSRQYPAASIGGQFQSVKSLTRPAIVPEIEDGRILLLSKDAS